MKKLIVTAVLFGIIMGFAFSGILDNRNSLSMAAQNPDSPSIEGKYTGGAKITEIFRIGLSPDDLLLESIQEVIDREKITDGGILSGIGSLKTCNFHYPASDDYPSFDKFVSLREPLEILSMSGTIADGKPHIHFAVSRPSQTIGGHLENGCTVLYLAEIVIAKFDGPPMTRRPDQWNTNILQKK